MLTTFPGNKKAWLEHAGTHSKANISGYSEDEKLVFAVLEAIDFSCWKYGDAPQDGIHEETAKAWLKENRKAVKAMKIEPPSYMGMMAGAFNFLDE